MSNRTLSFKGTHQEIGEQVGLQYKKWGKKEIMIAPFADSHFQKQHQIYEQYFPLYIEYLTGIAKGLGVSADLVLKSYLTGFLASAYNEVAHKCSVFAIKNKEGIFVGRNYDWLGASERISTLIDMQFSDISANSFTGISDMGTWEFAKPVNPHSYVVMFDDAWNSKGLWVGINGAPEKEAETGMSATHAVQAIVEHCSTTAQAIDMLQKIPLNSSKIFTLADKNGNFAVVEISLDKGIYVRSSSEYIFATNHFNTPDLLTDNLSIFTTVPFHSTFARYHYLEYSLLQDKERINIEGAIHLLSKPPIRQNWRGAANGDALSIWTYGLNLETLKYKIIFAPLLEEKEIVQN